MSPDALVCAALSGLYKLLSGARMPDPPRAVLANATDHLERALDALWGT